MPKVKRLSDGVEVTSIAADTAYYYSTGMTLTNKSAFVFGFASKAVIESVNTNGNIVFTAGHAVNLSTNPLTGILFYE